MEKGDKYVMNIADQENNTVEFRRGGERKKERMREREREEQEK